MPISPGPFPVRSSQVMVDGFRHHYPTVVPQHDSCILKSRRWTSDTSEFERWVGKTRGQRNRYFMSFLIRWNTTTLVIYSLVTISQIVSDRIPSERWRKFQMFHQFTFVLRSTSITLPSFLLDTSSPRLSWKTLLSLQDLDTTCCTISVRYTPITCGYNINPFLDLKIKIN